MTTTVTVKTHAWPVKVTTVDAYEQEQTCAGVPQHVASRTTTIEIVAPNSARDFYITSSRSLSFEEMPLPAAE